MQLVDLVQGGETVMGERPPVRAILEHVAIHAPVANERQQRGPLIDRDAGVVGLHERHPGGRAPIELHDIGYAADAVPDQAREDPPFALGPLREIAVGRVEEALRVASPLAGGDRLAIHVDVVAGHHLQAAATEHTIDLLGRHPA